MLRNMRRTDAILQEHAAYSPVLPTLYGAMPKAQQAVLEKKRERRMRRAANSGAVAALRAHANNTAGGPPTVLPFNGALTPRSLAAMTPRSREAMQKVSAV